MSQIDDVLVEYMERVDAGEDVDLEALLADHPEHADELRLYFEDVALVERMAGPPLAGTTRNADQSTSTEARVTTDAVANTTSTKSRALPATFGRYKIKRLLGRGAMGAVYLAHDTQLERAVALKTPTLDVAAEPDLVDRFYREAKSAATLRHANICPVYDVGEIDGVHYISMAYIDGRPLSLLITPKKLLRARVCAMLVRKLALALEQAHKAGVVHRDLKPANIMIDRQSEPLIMDFGLARRVDTTDKSRLTQEGVILGTPAYMSPEQIEEDESVGPQSDIYSLGVILFELLTGELPFHGSVPAVIGQILTQDAPLPSEVRPERREELAELDVICRTMMSRNVQDRYTSMREVADALSDSLKRDTSTAPRTISEDEELAAFLRTAELLPDRLSPTRRNVRATVGRSSRSSRAPFLSMAAAGLLLLLAVVILWPSPEGTVRVEVVGDESLHVLIDGEDITLSDNKWTGEAGEHRLALVLAGHEIPFDAKSKQFSLDDGAIAVRIAGVTINSRQRFEVVRDGDTKWTIELVRADPRPRPPDRHPKLETPPSSTDAQPSEQIAKGGLIVPDERGATARDDRPSAEPLVEHSGSGSNAVVDVLPLIQLERDRIHGDWTLQGRALANSPGWFNRLHLPYDVPDEYRIQVEVETDGKGGVHLGLLVGNSRVLAVLDSKLEGEHRSGLQQVDGKVLMQYDGLHSGQVLPLGKRVIESTVSRSGGFDTYSVRVDVDDETIIDWTGAAARLSNMKPFRVPNESQVALGTNGGRIRFTRVTIEPLR